MLGPRQICRGSRVAVRSFRMTSHGISLPVNLNELNASRCWRRNNDVADCVPFSVISLLLRAGRHVERPLPRATTQFMRTAGADVTIHR